MDICSAKAVLRECDRFDHEHYDTRSKLWKSWQVWPSAVDFRHTLDRVAAIPSRAPHMRVQCSTKTPSVSIRTKSSDDCGKKRAYTKLYSTLVIIEDLQHGNAFFVSSDHTSSYKDGPKWKSCRNESCTIDCRS